MNEEADIPEVEERDYEAEAKKDGWNSGYDGKNAKTAQEFVEAGENIRGIAVARAKKLEEQLETMQTRMDDIEATKREFTELNQRALAKERAEKAELVAKLEQRQIEAINEGDGDGYLRAKREIEKAQSVPEPRPGEEPWARAWAADNPWYAQDAVRRGVANAMAEELRKEGFSDTGRNFMDEVTKRTMKAIPEKFENPNRKNGITGGDGTKTDETATGGERSFEALPSDAKAACERFVAEGFGSKKDYLDVYHSA